MATSESTTRRIFRIPGSDRRTLKGKVLSGLERVLGLRSLERLYARLIADAPGASGRQFVDGLLAALDVEMDLDRGELARIPSSGPAIVVANHPHGGVDGLLLASAMLSVRSDVKIMANALVGRVAPLRGLLIAVDPLQGPGQVTRNASGLRESRRWLRDGGALLVFPAGEVSHLVLRRRTVADPVWSPAVAWLARRSGAPVVPAWIQGANRALFQMAGLVHPRLRTALLPRELLNKKGRRFRVRLGDPVPSAAFWGPGGDIEGVAMLRNRVNSLAAPTGPEPIAPGWDAGRLAAEVEALPPRQLLLERGQQRVYYARAAQIPRLLHEIGRLREVTFRAVGEGTLRSIDLDGHDSDYVHLFSWDAGRGALVGAYRIGETDRILERRGLAGLYTSTLFEYDPRLFELLGPALELGRSFVRLEYQRAYQSLLMLWQGIGAFVARRSRYPVLFGAVSVSADYLETSRHAIVSYLKRHHQCPRLSSLVKPRHPFAPTVPLPEPLARPIEEGCGVGELSALIAAQEPDRKGLPVLVRKYLGLGARLLAVQVDPAFSDSLDALMVVDLRQSDPRLLARYLGGEETIGFGASRTLRSAGLPSARTLST